MSSLKNLAWLAICHPLLWAQPRELAPLLPADTQEERPVREALLSGDIARARSLVDAQDPARRTLWKGILAVTQNDPALAIRTLRRADHPKVLGVAYYLARQHLLFRDQMKRAIQQDPADFGPYYYLGRHYDSDVDNLNEAIRWYRLALEKNPQFSSTRAHLGNCLERMGKVEEAKAEYLASSTVSLSMIGLARLSMAAGNTDDARKFIDQAVSLDPVNASALKLQSKIYARLGRLRDAASALERAISIDSRDPSLRYQLGHAYRLLGESVKAMAAFDEYERLRKIYGSQP